jgi:serine protease Do
VAASVVRIETFAGAEQAGELLTADAPTSGVIVTPDGYLVSSEFNFESKPSSMLITFTDGRRLPARLVARDHSRHIVLLKVDDVSNLPVAPIVDRTAIRVGQWAIAVGRTFDIDQVNSSVGIVSATNRVWGKAIQTDAKVSPHNYGGPLINIHGQVMGVLVPISLEHESAVASAAGYDSGIGFAVPIVDIHSRLSDLKQGQDLHRGILGISLKGNDIYGLPAEVGVVKPNSPAHKAGIKAGDIIERINEHPITRQVHLQHALGPLYAGQSVRLNLKRNEERIQVDATLTDKLAPFQQPFIGILPLRAAGDKIAVRYVYSQSPAEIGGIQVGDQILRVGEESLSDIDSLRRSISAFPVGESIELTILRAGTEEKISVKLDRLPDAIPSDVPVPIGPLSGDAKPPAKTGIVEVKLPEESGTAVVWVPHDYDHRVPHGLLVSFPAPGKKVDPAQFESTWKDLSASHDILVMSPPSQDSVRWLPTEVAIVRKFVDSLLATYNIDRTRVATYGSEAGGAMAILTAFAHRDLVTGVAAVDAPAPAGVRVPETDPMARLAVLIASSANSPNKVRVDRLVTDLREKEFQVTVLELGDSSRDLNADERLRLAHWLDCLDRI